MKRCFKLPTFRVVGNAAISDWNDIHFTDEKTETQNFGGGGPRLAACGILVPRPGI